jgi:hypothetical protein
MNQLYPHNDSIKKVIKNCADFVVRDGLNYLIPEWRKFTNSVSENDGSTIDEYLNDLDGRKIIDTILPLLAGQERDRIMSEIYFYDKQYISKTFEVKDCLWGRENELIHGFTRQTNFYYYRAPQYIIDQSSDIVKL